MWWLQSNNNESLSAFLNERDVEIVPLLTSLLEIVDEAAALARGFYEKVDELEVVRKGDATPLTDADTSLHLLSVSGWMRYRWRYRFCQRNRREPT